MSLSRVVDHPSTSFVLLRLRGGSKKNIIIEAKCSTRMFSIISTGDRGDYGIWNRVLSCLAIFRRKEGLKDGKNVRGYAITLLFLILLTSLYFPLLIYAR